MKIVRTDFNANLSTIVVNTTESFKIEHIVENYYYSSERYRKRHIHLANCFMCNTPFENGEWMDAIAVEHRGNLLVCKKCSSTPLKLNKNIKVIVKSQSRFIEEAE